MVSVFYPNSEPELVTAVALLEAHGIRCFVHNAGFGSLYPGQPFGLHNKRSIMVAEADVPTAVELLKDFRPGEVVP